MTRSRELMLLHDQELSAEEALDIEASLSDEERELLAGLEQVGDFVRAADQEKVDAFSGVADSVMAAIEADTARAAEPPGLRMPKLEAANDQVPVRARRNSNVVWVGVGLAAAAAAAVWISTPAREPPAPLPVAAPVATPVPSATAPEPAPELAAEATEDDGAPAASIEAVDFGNQPGSIFMVPAGEETTPVVWLVDEPAAGRIEPL